MPKTLTVFTPTYNRAYTLHKCYESLLKQSSQDFLWLIIDDGSTDNTKLLVESWMMENKISIEYLYQENQGMHGAHNTAYELIKTELNVCIDSDDYLADNAIEKIISFWNTFGGNNYAGIIGLDATPAGKIIGTPLPKDIKASTLTNLICKHRVKGDKKIIYRTDLIKNTPPYPLFSGEKYCPLSYKCILIDQVKPLLLLNETLCHVEYLEDGSSLNMVNQYRKNPKGFSFFRKTAMQYAPTLKERYREAVHYVSSNIMLRNKSYLNESPRKIVTILATPLGLMLYLYIKYTNKATVAKNLNG
ncbi:glycosyltransferase family 2 protein [Sutcliffiella horikoshii]|uniref:Glycosyltransferase family 2 protein n=1 Tax=Sutcliffiella horikoshii TaxID=79883 RepID=A0AA94WQZ6_9BACI|nr:glycosyltransferase family A protein [Sutcliffiella horikoshii]TYS60071.1 glycosyltransferase family 2 protein [Sutcliffiella horikoshii]